MRNPKIGIEIITLQHIFIKILNKKKYIISFALLGFLQSIFSQEWSSTVIPVKINEEFVWVLDKEHSDEFNYSGKTKKFQEKWIDNHRRNWSGPGLTQFDNEYSFIKNNQLIVSSGITRKIPNKRIYCGYVTSKKPIMYPVFTEVKMKVSGSWLSSNFWLLSTDDVNEIDVTETYGMDDVKGKTMNTNYHIFRRHPFKDLTPQNGKNHNSKEDVALKNDWHRFGVYWKSATEFIFYFNGKPVRSLNKSTDLKDPRGRYFDQPMHLIMNLEDHPWRVDMGKTPTKSELRNYKLNKMYVDWIRTYKLVHK